MINYTIIIPHKNAPDLLAYSLDTIPVRDDVQVIVVDDNSDPQKVDFANFPQWNGKHYEYHLTKEGKGAGYARNVGLDHAHGKWVLFVDADDFLLPTINDIFDECVDSNADLIYFRPKAVMLDDRRSTSSRADWYNNLIDEYYQTRDENNIRTRFHSPTCKIVRKSIIDKNSIRFDEIPYSNDAVFSVSVGCLAKNIEVRDESYYVITQSPNSLTSGFLSKPGELQVRSKAFFDAEKVIYNNGYKIDEVSAINFLSKLFVAYRNEFCKYFKIMQTFGYSRREIIQRMYYKQSMKFYIKRRYVNCILLLNRLFNNE